MIPGLFDIDKDQYRGMATDKMQQELIRKNGFLTYGKKVIIT